MGGSAFSCGRAPLRTPRMLPSIYHAQKQRCQALLRKLYVHVDSPIDGPGKKDFGDIDILVFQRRPEAPPPPQPLSDTEPGYELIHELATLLGSKRTQFAEKSSSNLAIPWPTDADDQVTPDAADDASAAAPSSPGSSPDKEQKYIQVDVRISPSLEEHNWMLFKHAHGDIWNIIGCLVRPYGLTIDDTGMYLRIPEIEKKNKKLAKVHLTSDPNRVLDFLGLPHTGAEYECIWIDEPFATPDAMFEYVALCRMMYVKPDLGIKGLQEDLENLKYSDRHRLKTRPVFKAWREGFCQRCRLEGRFAVEQMSREEVTADALEVFGVRNLFENRQREFRRESQRSRIRDDLIKGVAPLLTPDCTAHMAMTTRGCLEKGLKKIILERDESYGVQFDESMLDADGLYKEDEVKRFIEQHKEAVQVAAIAKHHALFIASKERKLNEQKQSNSEEQKAEVEAGKQEQQAEEQKSEEQKSEGQKSED
ncbi:hypothetical protein ISF_08264 [Cordyceps fumosorosea ARSEF 2679]|uniref:Uncharacterized protein n=1 Tax=Cordyceps fumosorosea (strain ARSEF 2679) TaxID=1081104 RepID=A0A167MR50_CORFA|nr:hypothetical protein ISF_08264 [Cordyceps fumosorosea ARSEF 2679]OAA54663.1 hypothetical protein ISF_08264 [Cordyceps fumosorosea ARSEF 2679]